jgi:hypothetical protein
VLIHRKHIKICEKREIFFILVTILIDVYKKYKKNYKIFIHSIFLSDQKHQLSYKKKDNIIANDYERGKNL